MRILGYTVAKNEASRYLECCLSWHSKILDGISLYDDMSSDNTAEIASNIPGVCVNIRSENDPSFLEHEGKFRQNAWRWFEECLSPTAGDWVLAFDADEFLVTTGLIRETLENVCLEAEAEGAMAVHVKIPEVFRRTKPPTVRMDGFWNKIVSHRLFRYSPNQNYFNKATACGAEPSYVSVGPFYRTDKMFLMHYGYAEQEDREAKYQRYSSMVSHGHANSHIESILQHPELEQWTGPWTPIWRGRK